MIRFLYLSYGRREAPRFELKYSYLTLRPHLDPARHRVVICTDDPSRFARWPVEIVAIADRMSAYSAGGRFGHRIKPAIMLDALRGSGDPAVYLDSDTIIADGFVTRVEDELWRGAIMNRFERADPIPELAGFEAALPHARYRYDRDAARMYNSGLIGARPDHAPIFEDALALIDAFLEQPAARAHHYQLEQFAIAEAFRLHNIAIAEIHDTLTHYWKRSWRRYAEWRLPKILPPDWDDLTAPTGTLSFSPAGIRMLTAWRSVKKRLPFDLGLDD